MTDTQLPKALQLAAMFDHPLPPDWGEMQAAAAELRRLHAELEQARAALAAQGEPVGEVFTMEALGTPGKPFCHVLLNRTLPTGTKLYTAAPAKPMTDEQPVSNPDELPKGFVPLQRENGKLVYAACLDGGRYHGWLMWKHPDGQWVTKRKMTSLEVMQAEDQDHYGIVQDAGKENP